MIDYELSELFARDGTTVDLEIRHDGGIITGAALRSAWTLDQGICSTESLRFGSFEVGQFKVSMANEGESLLGKEISLYLTIAGHADKPFYLGDFTVKDEALSADRKLRELVARDALADVINANVVDWYNSILPTTESAVTLSFFRNSFFQHFGIEHEEVNLVNDAMIVRRTVNAEEISGKRILQDILEPNGCFGLMSQGVFKYVFLGEPVASYSRYFGTTDEGFTTGLITKLQIRTTENDIGAVVGAGDNCYIMQDNMLLYGMSASEIQLVAENMLSVIRTVQYTPATLRVKGNPCIECGDGYSVTSKRGTFRSYVLQRSLTGKRSLKDTFAANGTKQYAEKVNSANRSIQQIRMKTNELTRTVDGTVSRVTELQEATIGSSPTSLQSQITQQAGQINLKVSSETFNSRVDDLQMQIDNTNQNYNVNYEPTLENYPAFDWAESPLLDITPFDADGNIYWIYTDQEYARHTRTSAFDEVTGTTYRFGRKTDGTWGWTPEASPEYASVMRRLSEIEVDVDSITQTVQTEYLTKDAASGLYATQSLLRSQIEVTSESITQSVAATYVPNSTRANDLLTINSSIKQTADAITAEVSRATGQEDDLRSRITITSNAITAETSRASEAEGTLRTSIKATADGLTAEITRSKKAEGDLSTRITATADGLSAEIKRSKDAESDLSTKITANAEGISAEIKRATSAEGSLQSSINANAYSISAEVSRAKSAEGDLRSSISITDSSISSEVTRAKNAESSLSSRITQTESSISSKVSKGSIISEINQTAESVTISANKINLAGIVSATEFTSKYATITALNAVEANFSKLNASNITTGTLSASRIDIDGLIKSSKMEAKYATVSSLNAVSADVKTIKSNYITASYINATNISAALNDPKNGSIAIGSVSTAGFYYYSGSGYESLYPMNVTINGKTYHLFGHV